MPRLVDRTRPNRVTTTERLRRAKIQKTYRSNVFIDQFPQIHGTVPEKMVYAALSKFGIPFYFLNDVQLVVPEIDFDKWYQADFIIPSAKVIIEVQGSKWHSTPQAIESDSFKFALYQMNGWTPLAFWDYDIFTKLDEMILSVPALRALVTNQETFVSRELAPLRRTKIDTSKGIRTLNAKRKIRQQYKKVIRYKGQRKGTESYTVK